MYKKIVDKAMRAGMITVIIMCPIMFLVKENLMKFLNRHDLTEYIKNHQSRVSVVVYLFMAIFVISIPLAVQCIMLTHFLRKNNNAPKE
jgi:Na+-driven multidrug efflux pump